ncbi:hypothetical protein ACQKGA_28290 [Priestia megaterium]|uniref:hypothetical protein n=1 Tax=Priestia megaterium TaxID=1404 RepID=UPI003D00E40C
MSLVSIIATQDFISVMTDGRISGGTQAERSENYPKFQVLVESKSFIAYVGDKEFAESVVEFAKVLASQGKSIKEIACTIQSRLSRGQNLAKHCGKVVELVIGGFDERVSQFYVVSNEKELKPFQPSGENYVLYANEVITQQDVESQLALYLKKNQSLITAEVAQVAQEKLLNYISRFEPSVNCIPFKHLLDKPQNI